MPTAMEILKEKDLDGGWHEIALQQEKNSCGPACVRMLKELSFNKKIGEDWLRGVVALFEKSKAHEGISPLSDEVKDDHDWTKFGIRNKPLLDAVKANPDGVLDARIEKWDYKPHLDKSSGNHPSILLVNWTKGGHWIVCVGPAKKTKDTYIILDPWYGVQSLQLAKPYEGEYSKVGKDATKKGKKFKGKVNQAVGVVVTYPAG